MQDQRLRKFPKKITAFKKAPTAQIIAGKNKPRRLEIHPISPVSHVSAKNRDQHSYLTAAIRGMNSDTDQKTLNSAILQ
jgi:hypothetical protein